MSIDSPEVEALLNSEQEEESPFPGARRILNWEQRIVGAFAACLPATAVTSLLKHLAFLHVKQSQQLLHPVNPIPPGGWLFVSC